MTVKHFAGRFCRRAFGLGLPAWLGLLALGFASTAVAQAIDTALTRERAIASFLVNALYYGQWPPSHDWQRSKVARLCILGQDTIGASLESVADDFQAQRFRNGRIVIQTATSPATLTDCHVVFIDTTDTELVVRTVSTLGRRPIITVSEAVGFAGRGGTFEIRIEAGKAPSWEINLDQLAASTVQVGSQMKIRASAFIQSGVRTTNRFR